MTGIETLLEPIPGAKPGGEDLTFHESLDAIREARRGDDPALSQGAWVTEVKRADWSKVRNLTGALLKERSKDLQLAGWHLEALARLHGFPGLTHGLLLVQRLVAEYWEALHPSLEEGLELRVGRMEWLATLLPELVASLVLVESTPAPYRLQDWIVARARAFQARNDADGGTDVDAPSLDQLEGALKRLGRDAGRARLEEIRVAHEAFLAFQSTVDQWFGDEAPLFDAALERLEGCLALFQAAYGDRTEAAAGPQADQIAAPTVLRPLAGDASLGREQALEALRAGAAYFKRHEPHSPVGPLVERALAWSGLSLDAWLKEVIREEGALAQVRTLLGFAMPHLD